VPAGADLTLSLHAAQRGHIQRGDTPTQMRIRMVLVCMAALALLVPSASGGDLQRGDGTLSVQNGRGTVVIQARGAVIGQVTRFERNGKLVIEDPIEGDGSDPIVRGADWVRERGDGTPVYGGKGVRFRLIGSRFVLRVTNAVGLQLSVVGKGRVTLDGAGSLVGGVVYDGLYSLNGDELESLPDEPTTFPLQPPRDSSKSR
jgi:hypothetical protein